MKKLKTLFKVLFLSISIFLLAACENIFAVVDFEITGVNGYSDAIINSEEKTISFNVSSAVNEFDVRNIEIPSNINIFVTNSNNEALSYVVQLSNGLNSFNLTFQSMNIFDFEVNEWKLLITKLSGAEKSVSGIEVSYFNDQYLKDQELQDNGYIKVTYTDGTNSNVLITRDMISNFDTSSLGQKTITISYNGFTATYTFEVVEELITYEVSISEIERKYHVGEEFKGGKLLVKYSNGTNEIVDILPSYVIGFDSSAVGTKEIEINYKGTSFKVTISIQELFETRLSEETVRWAYSIFSAFMEDQRFSINNDGSYEKYYQEYKTLSAEEYLNVHDVIGMFKFKEEQVPEIKRIYNEVAPKINEVLSKQSLSSTEIVNWMLTEFVTLENAQLLKDSINDLYNLISDEQIYDIENEATMFSTYNTSFYYIEYNEEKDKVETKYINFDEFIEQYKGTAIYEELQKCNSRQYYLTSLATVLALIEPVEQVFELDANDILIIARSAMRVIQISQDTANPNIKAQEIKDILNVLSKYLKRIDKNGTLQNLIDDIFEMLSKDETSLYTYTIRKQINDICDFASEHCDWVYKFLDSITLEDCEEIASLLNGLIKGELQDYTKLIVIGAKRLESTIDEIMASTPIKEKLKLFIKYYMGNTQLVDDILDYVKTVASYDENNLTNDQKTYIGDLRFLSPSSNESLTCGFKEGIIIPTTATEEEFFAILADLLTVQFTKNDITTAIQLNSSNVKGYTLNKKGAYTFTIYVENSYYNVYYLVADITDLTYYIEPSYIRYEYLLGFDLSTNTFDDYYFYKQESLYNQNTVDNLLDNIRIKYIYNNQIFEYKGISNCEYELIVINKELGYQLGYIKITTSESVNVYYPIQVVVFDRSNPKISNINIYTNCATASDGKEEIYFVAKGQSLYFYGQAYYNYGLTYDYIQSSDFTISGYDSNIPGIQNVTLSYMTYTKTIKVKVLTDSEVNEHVKILIRGNFGYGSVLTEPIELSDCSYDLYNRLNNYTSYDYQSLITYLNSYYNTEVNISFTKKSESSNDEYTKQINGIIYIKDLENKTLFECETHYYYLDPQHKDDLNSYIYVTPTAYGTYVVESYDEFDLETFESMISCGNANYRYKNGNVNLTKDELIAYFDSLSISYEEYDDYRMYTICGKKGNNNYNLLTKKVITMETANKLVNVSIISEGDRPILINQVSTDILKDYLSKYYYISLQYNAYTNYIYGTEMLNEISTSSIYIDYDINNGLAVVKITIRGFETSFEVPYTVNIDDYNVSLDIGNIYAVSETTDLLQLLKDSIERTNYRSYSYSYYFTRSYSQYVRLTKGDYYNSHKLDIDFFLNNLSVVEGQTLTSGETTPIRYKFFDKEFTVNVFSLSLSDTMASLNDVGYSLYIEFPNSFYKKGDTITVNEVLEQSKVCLGYYCMSCYRYHYVYEFKDSEIQSFIDTYGFYIDSNYIYSSVLQNSWYYGHKMICNESEKDDIVSISFNNGNSISYYYVGTIDSLDGLFIKNVYIINVYTKTKNYTIYKRSEIIDFLSKSTITHQKMGDYSYAVFISRDQVVGNYTLNLRTID